MIGPFVEDFGAAGDDPGDGTGTDDRAAFQAAFNASKVVFMSPAKTYRIHGPLYVPRFSQLVGLGLRSASEYWVSTGQTGATRLAFTGSGDACFSNQDTANMLSHGGMRGFVMRAIGTYSRMMYFRDMVDWHMSDIGMQTDSLTTAGIVSEKIAFANPSWTNSLVNVSVRLPDNSDRRTLNIDWSDSNVERCHLTGGLGVLERGYGTRFVNNQIERSKYVGLTIAKSGAIANKNTVLIGNSFDANKTHGVMFDATGDTSGTRKFHTVVVGNNFRTCDPNTGVVAGTSIALVNPSGSSYSIGPVSSNVELCTGAAPYATVGPWTTPSTF